MAREDISGRIISAISGETILIAGGVSVSGNIVQISGQHVFVESGVNVISTSNISGQAVTVSGNVVIAKISGETVTVAGGVSVSGNIVQISGQHVFVESGVLVVIQSGAGVTITQTTPTLVQTGAILAVTGTSGGVAISSGVVVSAVVKAIAGNSGDIYVGGSGATRNPFSGYGYLLRPGEAYGTDIDNLFSVKVVASTSGDKITFIGVG